MPAYVTLPGTSGNYFSTPDVNLLDADTAHGEQAASFAATTTQIASTTVSHVADSDAYFGNYVTRVQFTGGDVSDADNDEVVGTIVSDITLTAATYIVGVYVRFSENFPVGAGIRLQDEGTFAGSVEVRVDAIADGAADWKLATIEITPDAGDLTGSFFLRAINLATYGGSMDGTEAIDVGAIVLRAGTDASFVPSLRIVGDLDIEAKLALTDWTPAASTTVAARWEGGDPAQLLRVLTGGTLEMRWYSGGTARVATSTAATGISDGESAVIKVTVNSATGDTATFYVDGVQLGSAVDVGGLSGMDDGSSALLIGGRTAGTVDPLAGDIYYVIVRDGIDGPIVAKFDADDWVGI